MLRLDHGALALPPPRTPSSGIEGALPLTDIRPLVVVFAGSRRWMYPRAQVADIEGGVTNV